MIESPPPRSRVSDTRSALSAFERFVRVPIGFLWLIVLVLAAVPLMIVMTLVYYAAQAATALRHAPRRGRRSEGGGAEEHVA
mgnify:CR=1 FL=1